MGEYNLKNGENYSPSQTTTPAISNLVSETSNQDITTTVMSKGFGVFMVKPKLFVILFRVSCIGIYTLWISKYAFYFPDKMCPFPFILRLFVII
jgi:hypothetical protein